jgi:hypothetical protein
LNSDLRKLFVNMGKNKTHLQRESDQWHSSSNQLFT